jgi:diguanylate cyclase (GGDEF)-like protein/PAS domain S-box-containing protein
VPAQPSVPSRVTLKGRIRLALFAVLVPMLVVGSISALLLRSSARDSHAAQDRASALAQIAQLQNVLTGSGTPMTSVLRTGSTATLDRFLADHSDTQSQFDALALTVPPAAHDKVVAAGRGWSAIVADLTTLRSEARNGSSAAMIPLLVRLADEVIIPEHDLELASNSVAKDLHTALVRTHAHQQEQQRILLLLALVGVLLVAVLSRYLNRTIGTPLVQLRQAAERLRYGVPTEDEPSETVPVPRTPELAAVASAFNDMTRRLADGSRLLSESEARHRALVTHSSDLVVVVEPDTTVISATPSSQRLLGLTADELVGRRLADLVPETDIPVLLHSLEQVAVDTLVEFAVRSADGRCIETEAHVVDLLVEPAVRGIVLTLRDVSERRELERRLSYQAFHDSLTGLPNRALLRDRLTHALLRRSEDLRVALLFLDLNDFKTVNDSLGHSAGDELLQLIAARLELQLRASDTASRLGGDEFVVLLEEVGEAEALALAERLRATLGQPVELAGLEVFPQAAIGVALSGAATTADELLAHADAAMYAAKTQAGGICLYQPGLGSDVLQRLELKAELQRALSRSEFEVHYQPAVELETGRITGVEALVRWRHPERGLVPPLEFIPLAEETGCINEIGAYVLREACGQLATWQRELPDSAPRSISVNVSGRQLFAPDFVGQVRNVLAATGLAAKNVILEITETVLVGDDHALLERLHELRGLGIRLAIDDFGTGYSSLAYLQRLPFDILKIDKSFVDGLMGQGQQGSLVATIVALARDLQLDTVAEGIEAAQQAESLVELGCHHGQGYLFARPTTAAELTSRFTRALTA